MVRNNFPCTIVEGIPKAELFRLAIIRFKVIKLELLTKGYAAAGGFYVAFFAVFPT